MTYQISRDGQEFGPYSLADVQRYVGTGNILLTDLARAEGTTEWLPVSGIVGTIPVPQQPLVPAGYAPLPNFPDPPNLHWGLVLLFAFLTCGIFTVVWDLIQVQWLRKIQPESKAFLYYMIFLGLWLLNFVFSFGRMGMVFAHRMGGPLFMALAGVSGLITLGFLTMMIVYRFAMRSALEQHFNGPDPVGLSLSGVMTFFFGGLYFQYHLNRIMDIKRGYRLSNPTSPY